VFRTDRPAEHNSVSEPWNFQTAPELCTKTSRKRSQGLASSASASTHSSFSASDPFRSPSRSTYGSVCLAGGARRGRGGPGSPRRASRQPERARWLKRRKRVWIVSSRTTIQGTASFREEDPKSTALSALLVDGFPGPACSAMSTPCCDPVRAAPAGGRSRVPAETGKSGAAARAGARDVSCAWAGEPAL